MPSDRLELVVIPSPPFRRQARPGGREHVHRGDGMIVDEWRQFGVRDLPSMSARRRFPVPDMIAPLVEERVTALARPLLGITTDGVAQTGLRDLDSVPEADPGPITDAVVSFVQALTPAQRQAATFPIDADEWRQWINVHMNFYRHGVLLDDLSASTRELALDILRATLSARGFVHARSIMLINELVAQITGDNDAFGGWLYFVSVFGTPGTDEPWGWQIDGHHLCLNVVVVDGRVVTTPAFMGSEPRTVHNGPLAGTELFEPEESLGLRLVQSLDAGQRLQAVVHPSIYSSDISPDLQHLFDGRMQGGGAHDNVLVPYQGVPGGILDQAQRQLMLELAGTYTGWSADEHAKVRMREIEAHLDDTWFSWYGDTADNAVFYYRLHSPVVLIEFDHHPGVVFDNVEPTRHHVHTLVRTPNGGDYGADLLAQHYQRYDHSSGSHHVSS